MKQIASLVIICLVIVMSGCVTSPEHSAKVYTNFTEHEKYQSGMYKDMFAGKDYKMQLYYHSNPSAAGYYNPDVVLLMATPNKEGCRQTSCFYVTTVPSVYRDVIFTLKGGDPITVYGTILDVNGVKRSLLAGDFVGDKLVKGHE